MMSKLAVKTLAEDPVHCVVEVTIPLEPGDAVLTAQALRHLAKHRKRAFDRLGIKGDAAGVTAVEYRVEGNDLIVHVLQGMLG